MEYSYSTDPCPVCGHVKDFLRWTDYVVDTSNSPPIQSRIPSHMYAIIQECPACGERTWFHGSSETIKVLDLVKNRQAV